jgi:hypothetical protein
MNAIDDRVSTLTEIERVRARTRASLNSIWYPLVLFGAASLGAAAVAALDVKWIGVYWLLAYGACFLAVRRYAVARAGRIGVGELDPRGVRLWLAFPLVLIVAGTIAGTVGGVRGLVVANAVVVGAWYLLVARWVGSTLMAVLGIAVIAVTAVLAAVVDPDRLIAVANLAIGAVLLAGGLYAHSRDESP